MKELIEAVRLRLPEKRFEHSLSVAQECLSLASLYSMTIPMTRKLYKAAILHDLGKAYPTSEQASLAGELGIELSEDDLTSPEVIHQYTGAALAKRDFPAYTDEIVYSAISKHTTGDSVMNLTDKLLCLADFIEPTRPYDSCREIRSYFYSLLQKERKERALDMALIAYLENTISHLEKEGKPVHNKTREAYSALLRL